MSGIPHRADRSSERGVAVLATVMLVMLLLVAVTGAFLRGSGEFRTALDQTSTVDAFALAQSGLDAYLSAQPTVPAIVPDTQQFNLPGGSARVVLRISRVEGKDTTYVLVSRGENTTTNRYDRTTARGGRTVAQLLRWSGARMELPGAIVALSGFEKNGASGQMSGNDRCTTGAAPLPSIPGVAVPSKGVLDPTPHYSGPTTPIDGNPDNLPVPIGTPGSGGSAKDSVKIDWAAIVARKVFTPTYYRSPGGSWTPNSPPSGGTDYPVTFIDGDHDGKFPGNGRGILIVTGDLKLSGNDTWLGLVLVGQTLESKGNNKIFGALFSGLNLKLGTPVPVQALGTGDKQIQYDSCEIAAALQPFAGWQRIGNAWVDNWPAY